MRPEGPMGETGNSAKAENEGATDALPSLYCLLVLLEMT